MAVKIILAACWLALAGASTVEAKNVLSISDLKQLYKQVRVAVDKAEQEYSDYEDAKERAAGIDPEEEMAGLPDDEPLYLGNCDWAADYMGWDDPSSLRGTIAQIAFEDLSLSYDLEDVYPNGVWKPLVAKLTNDRLRRLQAMYVMEKLPNASADAIAAVTGNNGSEFEAVARAMNAYRDAHPGKYPPVSASADGCGAGGQVLTVHAPRGATVQYMSNLYYNLCDGSGSTPTSFCKWNDYDEADGVELAGRIAFKVTDARGTRITVRDVDYDDDSEITIK